MGAGEYITTIGRVDSDRKVHLAAIAALPATD
jgi:hypothetical protein